jgi:xylulokinase
MSLLLGIDIGTSSVKCALVNPDDASIVAVSSREYPLHIPRSGYAEQSAEDWWQTTVHAVKDTLSQVQEQDVAAIGFSGQMHGGVLLDEAGKALHPAIIWADQRSATQVQDLLASVGDEATYLSQTGTLPATGFMGPTLLWIKKHRPELLDATYHFLLPKDYVRFRMTGEMATDVSDAASSGLFDVKKRQWARPIIDAVDLPNDIFPPVLASDAIAGQLQALAAHELELPEGIPVIAGCADQPAQALGNGIIGPGLSSITIGSGGQVFYPVSIDDSDTLKTDRRIHVFNHAANGGYALGAILSAGLTMRWLRNLVGLGSNPNAYKVLSAEAEKVAPGSDGLMFLPYLNGERTPHMDERARGAFIGLASHHTRGHMARAVMEGVSFAMRQCYEICADLGNSESRIVVSGGGMDSDVWRQILADVLDSNLYRTHLQEQAVVGAAMLGGVGCRLFGDTQSENFATLHTMLAVHSDMTKRQSKSSKVYQARYAHFCEMYPRLKSDFHRLVVG